MLLFLACSLFIVRQEIDVDELEWPAEGQYNAIWPEENKWKIFKKIGDVFKKVGKAVSRAVSAVGKAIKKVGQAIWDKSSDVYENPIVIDQIETDKKIGNYTRNTIADLQNDLIADFNLSPSDAADAVTGLDFTVSKRFLLNFFQMDYEENNPTQRYGKLQTVDVSYTREEDGKHSLDVKQVVGTADVTADMTRKSTKELFGIKVGGSKTVTFRPLTADELTQLYSKLLDEVKAA